MKRHDHRDSKWSFRFHLFVKGHAFDPLYKGKSFQLSGEFETSRDKSRCSTDPTEQKLENQGQDLVSQEIKEESRIKRTNALRSALRTTLGHAIPLIFMSILLKAIGLEIDALGAIFVEVLVQELAKLL